MTSMLTANKVWTSRLCRANCRKVQREILTDVVHDGRLALLQRSQCNRSIPESRDSPASICVKLAEQGRRVIDRSNDGHFLLAQTQNHHSNAKVREAVGARPRNVHNGEEDDTSNFDGLVLEHCREKEDETNNSTTVDEAREAEPVD